MVLEICVQACQELKFTFEIDVICHDGTTLKNVSLEVALALPVTVTKPVKTKPLPALPAPVAPLPLPKPVSDAPAMEREPDAPESPEKRARLA